MTSERRKERVRRLVENAHKALEAAKSNADLGHWSTAGNRIYYACFYAVKALLLYHDFEADTHSGAKTLFGKHFVQSGPIEKSEAKFYSNLFRHRLKADYDVYFEPDPEQLRARLPKAEQFIETVVAHLDNPPS